jgi:hypothetical protein
MSTQKPYSSLWKPEVGDSFSSHTESQIRTMPVFKPFTAQETPYLLSSARVTSPHSPKLYATTQVSFDNKIFRLPESERFKISSQATASQDEVSDISSLIRTVAGSVPPELSTSDLFANSPFYPIQGLTSFFNFFQGIFVMMKAAARYRYCQSLGHKKGMELANVEWSRGLSQLAGGAAYGICRGLTLGALLIHGPNVDISWINVPTFLGRASAWAGAIIGTFFFSVFYLLLAAQCGYLGIRGYIFKQKLETAEKPFEFLEKKLDVSEAHILEKYRKECVKTLFGKDAAEKIEAKIKAKGELSKEEILDLRKHYEEKFLDGDAVERIDDAVDDKLLNDATFFGTLGLKKCLQECGLNPLKEGGYEKVLSKIYSDEQLKQIALSSKVALLRVKKEDKLAELSSGRALNRLKKVLSKPEEDQSEKAMNKTVAKIKSAISSQNWSNGILAGLCLLGLAVTVVSLFFTGGAVFFFITMGFIAVAVGMLGADGYCLHQALKSGENAPYDRKIMWASIALSILLLAAVIVLSVLFHFALAPILIASVICLGTVATNGTSLYFSHKNEKKRQMKHPSLAFLKDFVAQGESKKKIDKLFRRLQIDERRTLKEQLEKELRYEHRKKRALLEAIDETIIALKKKERQRNKSLKKYLFPIIEKYLVS